MTQVFTFSTSLMNGTVTMQTQVSAFASKELAERARQAVIQANRNNATLGFMETYCSEVVSVDVYETEADVPILNKTV